MDININVKLSHQKDSDYNINVDIDPERVDYPQANAKPIKTELGAVKRPDADRLKILRNPVLAEEDKATEKVMDELDLE